MLIIQTLRPDRLLAATSQFVSSVLGAGFMQAAEQEMNLADIVDNEASYLKILCLRLFFVV